MLWLPARGRLAGGHGLNLARVGEGQPSHLGIPPIPAVHGLERPNPDQSKRDNPAYRAYLLFPACLSSGEWILFLL